MLNTLAGIIASSGGAAGGATSYESIATVTVGSGGSSSISFSSIPSTYQHLQIRVLARENVATQSDNLTIQFNSDTAGNYQSHYLYGTGSSAAAGAETGSQTTLIAGRVAGTSSGSNVFGASIVDILDYKDTNKYKTVRTLTGVDANGSGIVMFESGAWRSTAAVSSITLATGGTFVQYSSFALYGIKG